MIYPPHAPARRLSTAQHQAIVNKFVEGRSVRDIARHFALREQSVEATLRQAMAILIRQLPDLAPLEPPIPLEQVRAAEDAQ